MKTRKNKVLTIFIFFIILSTAHAQFEFYGLGGKQVNKLYYFDRYLYAASNDGVYKKVFNSIDTVWIPIGLQGENIKALLVLNPDTLFASIEISGMGSDTIAIFLSTNGGMNWRSYQNGYGGGTGYSNHVLAFEAYSNNELILFATGLAQIAKSTDFGNSWHTVWSDWEYSGMGVHFIKIDPASPQIIWSGGEGGYFQPFILKSRDYGESWQTNFIDVGGDNACYSCAIHPSDTNIVYIGMEGRIIKTSDGGKTWEMIFSPDTYPYFFGIQINSIKPDIIYASGASSSQYLILYYSNNGGKDWDSISTEESISKGVCDLLLVDNQDVDTLFLATNGSGVYRLVKEISNIEDMNIIRLPKYFHLEQNYPNPFNSETIIEFTLFKPSFVSLNIYNTLGEKISSLVNKNLLIGNYKYSWNSKNFNSGLYIYRLQTVSQSETKKLLFIK